MFKKWKIRKGYLKVPIEHGASDINIKIVIDFIVYFLCNTISRNYEMGTIQQHLFYMKRGLS